MGRGVKQSTSRELSGGFLEYISLHNSTPCRGLLLSDKLVKTWSWRPCMYVVSGPVILLTPAAMLSIQITCLLVKIQPHGKGIAL